MRVAIALLLLITFEIVVLVTGLAFGQPLFTAVVVAAAIVVAIGAFGSSDFVFERWERWRDRGR